jgi:hypothetical protein
MSRKGDSCRHCLWRHGKEQSRSDQGNIKKNKNKKKQRQWRPRERVETCEVISEISRPEPTDRISIHPSSCKKRRPNLSARLLESTHTHTRSWRLVVCAGSERVSKWAPAMARELRWFLLDKWVADMLISPRCSVDYETLGARISTNESTQKMMLDRVRIVVK